MHRRDPSTAPPGASVMPAWRLLVAVLAGAVAPCIATADAPMAPTAPTATTAVRLEAHGGKCDGTTDNSPALAKALAQAKALRVPVLVPQGRCAYSDIIRVDGVTLTGMGEGSVLHSLNWRRSAIFMSGQGPQVSRLTLTGAPAPGRQAPWEMTRITVVGATDFVIHQVVIDGSGAAGIQTARAPRGGRITQNVVRNTLSDGIHITDGASQILVEGNQVEASGDDGIAVVSYWHDKAVVNNVTARRNVVRNNRAGRNMSVVGGSHVHYAHNLMDGNAAGRACLYIAQETGDFTSKGARHVTAEHNTLANCGGGRGHGAVMVFSNGKDLNEHVWLIRNDVQAGDRLGIRVYSAWNVDVRLEANRVSGNGRLMAVSGPSVSVTPYDGGAVGHQP